MIDKKINIDELQFEQSLHILSHTVKDGSDSDSDSENENIENYLESSDSEYLSKTFLNASKTNITKNDDSSERKC